MEAKKIYHVHLFEPYEEKTDYYFGSIVAIFQTLSPDVLGVKYSTLCSKKLTHFENKKCVINVDEIKRSPRK